MQPHMNGPDNLTVSGGIRLDHFHFELSILVETVRYLHSESVGV
jgi:hypothetical protein